MAQVQLLKADSLPAVAEAIRADSLNAVQPAADQATAAAVTATTQANNASLAASEAQGIKETVEGYATTIAAEFDDKGVYNASTNTPTLSADATIGQSGTKRQKYTVTVPGVVGFAGENFSLGAELSKGDELRQFSNGKWLLIPRSDLALTIAEQASNEVFSGEQDSSAYLVPFTDNASGWAGTAFQGCMAGTHFATPTKINKLKLELTQINNGTNAVINVSIWRRLYTEANSGGAYGTIGTDVMLYEVNLTPSAIATGTGATFILVPFTQIETSATYIYGFRIRAWTVAVGSGVGKLGFTRTPSTPSTLPTYERGGTYSGTNGVFAPLLGPTAFRISWEFLTTSQVSRFPGIDNKINELTALTAPVPVIENRFTNGTELHYTNFETGFPVEGYSNVGWIVSGGGIKSTANGNGNFCALYREYGLSKRKSIIRVSLPAGSKFLHGVRGFAATDSGTNGTGLVLDAETNLLAFYPGYLSTTTTLPTTYAVSSPFTFVPNRIYEVELIRDGYSNIGIVTDTVTGHSATVTNTTNNGTGMHRDRYYFANVSGEFATVYSHRVTTSLKKYANAIFFGDSNTDARYTDSPINDGDGFAYKLAELLSETGVSGRGGGGVDGVIRRLQSEGMIIQPQYTVITIGTNEDFSTNQTTLLNKYRQAIQIALDYGSTVILNNIPMNSGGTGVPSVANPLLESLREEYNIRGSKFDIATAQNGDPSQGLDMSIAVGGVIKVHFSATGHDRISNRFKIDFPQLFF